MVVGVGATLFEVSDLRYVDGYAQVVVPTPVNEMSVQLKTQGIWMSLDWSTGAITEFLVADNLEGGHAMDRLVLYLNLRLTPDRFAYDAEFSRIKFVR